MPKGIKDYFMCKQTTKEIGNLYFRSLGGRENALVFFKKALTYINTDESKNLKDASESLDIFANIANIYSRKDLYNSAHYYFQLAFDQIRPGINETGILNSSSEEIKKVKKIHYLTALIIDKGDAYRKQFEGTKESGALGEAIRIYKVADQFLNKIKAEQTDVQSKLFWRSDSRHLYENAIEACYFKNLADGFIF
jgi:tetratricopeptide (TPR) repeat protein